MKQFDMIIIGGGSAGLSAAYRIARAGRRVALIDKGPVGGLCSLAGCNPKKVLVRASEVLETVRHAAEHGVITGDVTIDWERVWRRKHSFTDPVPDSTEKSLANAGVERVRGVAHFVDEQTVAVGGEEFRADGFVIATGSHPRRLDVPGADLLKISDDALELQSPPKRMVIVGAGVIAAQVTSVTSDGDSYRVEFTREGATDVRDADFVLNAAGRVPAIEELDLPKAKVQTTLRGVVVDKFLRSQTNPRVFAGGDAHGARQLSPVSSYEGRVIAQNFLQGDVREVDYATVPQSIFTTPPLASVGLTETIAKEKHQVEVRASDMTRWLLYSIAGEPVARAKIVIDSGTGRILGAQLFGVTASENIHLFALAIQFGVTVEHLKEMVYAYPTFASTIQSLLA